MTATTSSPEEQQAGTVAPRPHLGSARRCRQLLLVQPGTRFARTCVLPVLCAPGLIVRFVLSLLPLEGDRDGGPEGHEGGRGDHDERLPVGQVQ